MAFRGLAVPECIEQMRSNRPQGPVWLRILFQTVIRKNSATRPLSKLVHLSNRTTYHGIPVLDTGASVKHNSTMDCVFGLLHIPP